MLNKGERTGNDNCILEAGFNHSYTYKFRGMSIGCQPEGFLKWKNAKGYEYEIITYDHELTEKEMLEYELIEI